MALTRNADAVAPVRKSSPLAIWFGRHTSIAIGSLGRLFQHPFSSLMIVLVIAVTLALPAAINLVVKNARSISGSWDNALDFSVFLNKEIPEDEAGALGRGCESPVEGANPVHEAQRGGVGMPADTPAGRLIPVHPVHRRLAGLSVVQVPQPLEVVEVELP